MTRAYLRSFPGVRLTIVIPFFYAALIAVSGRWQFIGDVYLTLETLPNATIYVLPLVAGLAAFDTSQIAQPGLSSILSVATRGRIARFLPSLAVASASATFHVIVSGLMLVLGGITSPRVGWWMVCWTIAIQCAMFFVMALLGAVVAFVVAPRIAAFFSFLIAFIYILSATMVTGFAMIRPLGSSTRQIWWTWNLDYRIVQSLVLAVSILALVFTLRGFRPVTEVHSAPDYARLAVSGLALSVGFLLPDVPYKAAITPEPARTLCTQVTTSHGERLEFCGYPEDERYLPYLEGVTLLGYEFLRDANLLVDEMPRRFGTYGPDSGDDPDPGVILLSIPSDVADSLVVRAPLAVGVPEAELIANSFVIPPSCYSAANQHRLFAGGSTMADAYDFLVTSVFDTFDGANEDVSPEEFRASYREIAAWCDG